MHVGVPLIGYINLFGFSCRRALHLLAVGIPEKISGYPGQALLSPMYVKHHTIVVGDSWTDTHYSTANILVVVLVEFVLFECG